MVKLIRIDSKTKLDDKLIVFCQSAHFSEDPTAENIEFLDWENRPETLLNQIYKQKVYDEGGYFCLEKNDKFVAGCGYYPYEDDHNIATYPVRLYVIPELGIFRGITVMQVCANKTLQYIKEQDYRALLCFINEHNLWRMKFRKTWEKNDWTNSTKNWQPIFPGHAIKIYEKLVDYKFTKQYAMYCDYSNYEDQILKCLEKIAL